MTAADPHSLLVVCALVSDLYCPSYKPRQPLEKDSNLSRAAALYKIDSEKIAAGVRVELSKPKGKLKNESQPAKKPTKTTTHPAQKKCECKIVVVGLNITRRGGARFHRDLSEHQELGGKTSKREKVLRSAAPVIIKSSRRRPARRAVLGHFTAPQQ